MKRSTKRIILILHDMALLAVSVFLSKEYVAVLVNISSNYTWFAILFLSLIYFIFAFKNKIFSTITKYTDDSVLLKILLGLLLAYSSLLISSWVFWNSLSYRFIFMSYIFSVLFLIFPRGFWRYWHNKSYNSFLNPVRGTVRTLVVGAGEGGNLFIKTVNENSRDIHVVGVIDSDANKLGSYIQGKKVLGNRNDIPRLVRELEIDQITIAIPSLSSEERERYLELANEIGVPVKSMPSVEDIILGNISQEFLRDIDLADLLGRDEVILDQQELGFYFCDKTVLVTGAGGSIGSEICRQVSNFKPKRLILLGHGENSIYQIHRELTTRYAKEIEIVPVIADIQDRERIFEIMENYRPDMIYHAAAHKHVPLMEYNPKEAVKNNIFGTKNVAEATKAAGVPKFVMVSTDKAVNPPNVMGATKRVAEMIVTGLNEEGKTQFVSVRFGNVLGSRGSVVPVFKEQIAQGGPVTVTDFRMTRYFMTIPEASRLVIQAGYLAKGGEIFVLDMGEPVLIKDLAKKVIKLSGYTEDQIGIVESGIRPGEKLYEELLSTEERVSQQIYDKIFVGKVTSKSQEEVTWYINQLNQLTESDLKKSLIHFTQQE